MEKINKFKKILYNEKIDGYIIPKNDEFFGEYIPDYNDRLKYISNFSGSFGYALILKDKNYLFVDGRYTLQAKNQSGKNFNIVTFPNKMPYHFLKNKKLIIGYDPKLFTKKTLKTFFVNINSKFIPINFNFIDKIWVRKIKKNNSKFYCLPTHSVGSNFNSKISKIINNLKKTGADFQFISASENNAWLLNIRGSDSEFSPIPNGYILINKKKEINFFCDLNKIPFSVKKSLNIVKFYPIKQTEKIISKIYDKKFIIDENTCSLYFENIILKNNKILTFKDPIYDLKSIKTDNEIKNIQKIHIDDGVALTKYLFWIKKNYKKKKITEMSASQKLYEFRKKNNKFQFLSFPTISGTGPNGAIIHYKATKKTNRTLKKGDIYLVDSGGQYKFGTTDVTRTISLENTNKRVKNIFTRVLKGHIAVANFKLSKSTTGSTIDGKARKYLKQIGLNYPHGTGHGVGYFLNVHEGPQAISKNNNVTFKEGMVISNEPGYYEKNKFGIRIENLVFVKKENKGKYFENLTMAPIDKDLIDRNMLNREERRWINDYHTKVFKNLKNAMNREEEIELKKACSAI